MTAILTDPHLKQAFRDIIEQANVSEIIETGTNHGESTLEFAKMVDHVMTIEADEPTFQIAGRNLEMAIYCKKVILIWSDSAKVFRQMEFRPKERTLTGNLMFVLDAHWEEAWPLLDELQGINRLRSESGIRTTVLIDDFRVPGRDNFWFCRDGRNDRPDGIVCGDNEPFDAELAKFPHVWYPDYDADTIGYGIFTDFDLDLGQHFRRER